MRKPVPFHPFSPPCAATCTRQTRDWASVCLYVFMRWRTFRVGRIREWVLVGAAAAPASGARGWSSAAAPASNTAWKSSTAPRQTTLLTGPRQIGHCVRPERQLLQPHLCPHGIITWSASASKQIEQVLCLGLGTFLEVFEGAALPRAIGAEVD